VDTTIDICLRYGLEPEFKPAPYMGEGLFQVTITFGFTTEELLKQLAANS
jgi:hypothetical protein